MINTQSSAPTDKRFQQFFEQHNTPLKIAALYLVLFTLAEFITAYIFPPLGVFLHILVLVALIIHSAFTPEKNSSRLIMSLMVIPMIRIISIGLPLFVVNLEYWYTIVGIPLILSAWVIMRLLNLSWRDVGFRWSHPLLQIGVILFGFILGFIEYIILQPGSIIDELTLFTFVIATVSLFIGTGVMEELVFRGLIQQVAEPVFQKWGSIFFSAILFMIMHIGWQSFIDLMFVFSAGFLWGYVFWKTRSIIGITISHTVTNVTLFIIMPFLFPQFALLEFLERVEPARTAIAAAPESLVSLDALLFSQIYFVKESSGQTFEIQPLPLAFVLFITLLSMTYVVRIRRRSPMWRNSAPPPAQPMAELTGEPVTETTTAQTDN